MATPTTKSTTIKSRIAAFKSKYFITKEQHSLDKLQKKNVKHRRDAPRAGQEKQIICTKGVSKWLPQFESFLTIFLRSQRKQTGSRVIKPKKAALIKKNQMQKASVRKQMLMENN